MVDFYRDSNEIKETDIIFDCPNCGKSLAIDYRGAGLSIPCTDCGQYVDVPIPEGMELTDIDSSDEEQEMRILNLRRALVAAENRVRELQARVDMLERRNTDLAEGNGEDHARVEALAKHVEELRRHLGEIANVVGRIDQLTRPAAPVSAPVSD